MSSSVRRRVAKRVRRLSLYIGAAAAGLAVLAFFAQAARGLPDAKRLNAATLSSINCTADACDASNLNNDSHLVAANYVIDSQSRFVLNIPPREENDSRLTEIEFSDVSRIAPGRLRTPDGTDWYLYFGKGMFENRPVEVVVGYALHASWKLVDAPETLVPEIKEKLRQQADRIAAGFPHHSNPKIAADGYEVVDAKTGELLDWNLPPAFLPNGVNLPRAGYAWWPRIIGSQFRFVITDANQRLIATSVVTIGPVWVVAAIGSGAFLLAALFAGWVSRRFLQNYLAFADVCLPTIEEAVRLGEGQSVEFKKGLSDDAKKTGGYEAQLLESVAAFANTNDGLILIGIDDVGNICGLQRGYQEQDRLKLKIEQMIRDRISPKPPAQFVFEELEGKHIGKITVARGDAPAYLLNGVVYIRHGSADVPARPEDLSRLFAEYASG
jgi:hypothetical protein